MTTRYRDEKGRLVFVGKGIGDEFMSLRQGASVVSSHRVKTRALPLRETRDEAQADLDAYAARKGWVRA